MDNETFILRACISSSIIASIAVYYLVSESIKRRRSRGRRWWVRPVLEMRKEGAVEILLNKVMSDGFYYKTYLRMTKETFTSLLTKIEPLIATKNTKLRQAVPCAKKLAVTLRYLATGE